MDSVGVGRENGDIDISPEDFKSGCMIMSYDGGPDQCNSFHTHKLKNGTIGIELSFKELLRKPIKLIVYAVYHSQLKLDQDRNAKIEYVV